MSNLSSSTTAILNPNGILMGTLPRLKFQCHFLSFLSLIDSKGCRVERDAPCRVRPLGLRLPSKRTSPFFGGYPSSNRTCSFPAYGSPCGTRNVSLPSPLTRFHCLLLQWLKHEYTSLITVWLYSIIEEPLQLARQRPET